MNHLGEAFGKITTFVFDMDGVLTDGSLVVLPNGVFARSMHTKDGYALQLAVKKGYQILIITGGNAPEVSERFERLGIQEIHLNIRDKAAVLNAFMQKTGTKAEAILCMGDDVPDIPIMRMAGIAACPADAAADALEVAQYISPIAGGRGCVRDVIEKVLRIRGHWGEETTVTSA